MNDLYKQLKYYGVSTDTIYNIMNNNDLADYIDEADLGYYDSERFYAEDGRSVRKGGTYISARFENDWAA